MTKSLNMAARCARCEGTPTQESSPCSVCARTDDGPDQSGSAASSDLARVYEAFGIGEQARDIETLLLNIGNARRRSECLWRVEREFFTTRVPAEFPEVAGDLAEECPLSWGASPEQYVEQFSAALAARAPAAEGHPQAGGLSYQEAAQALRRLYGRGGQVTQATFNEGHHVDQGRAMVEPGKWKDAVTREDVARWIGQAGSQMTTSESVIEFLCDFAIYARKDLATGDCGAGAGDNDRFDLIAHIERQRAFSLSAFGPGLRTNMVIDHIQLEIVEIQAAPTDLKEWVDMVLLGIDGAWRTGATSQQIAHAIAAKLAKNETRVWPDWRLVDQNKAIQHDRTHDASSTE